MSNPTKFESLEPESPDPAIRVSTPQPRAEAVVVLPTLNEELGLERTLSELPMDRFGDPAGRIKVVIIDGGSTDRTLEVARKWNIRVLHQRSKGKGAAMLEAVDWVRQQGIPYVIVLDADATYPPSAILPAFHLLREGVDLVTGSRRPVGGPPKSLRDLVHRIGNIGLSYTASVLTRRPILDICSGFWGVRTERFAQLGIGTAEFAIEAELVMKALGAGLEVAQIPIEYRDRLGTAKIHAARDGGAILLSIVQFAPGRRVRDAPSHVAGVPARELLSIALIAEFRTAVLECQLSELQMANRLGLLLNRSLPGASVRVRPSGAPSTHPTPARSAADQPPLMVSLPSPGDAAGSSSLSIAIRPLERELTARLTPPSVEEATHPSRRRSRRHPPGHWAGRSANLLAALTTRLNFDPRRQQATILLANGFTVVSEPDPPAPDVGGRPA